MLSFSNFESQNSLVRAKENEQIHNIIIYNML